MIAIRGSIAPAAPAAVVRRHPAGGWTHAVHLTGSARIYRGNWATACAARAALQGGAK